MVPLALLCLRVNGFEKVLYQDDRREKALHRIFACNGDFYAHPGG
jgi:hypothetical protein